MATGKGDFTQYLVRQGIISLDQITEAKYVPLNQPREPILHASWKRIWISYPATIAAIRSFPLALTRSATARQGGILKQG